MDLDGPRRRPRRPDAGAARRRGVARRADRGHHRDRDRRRPGLSRPARRVPHDTPTVKNSVTPGTAAGRDLRFLASSQVSGVLTGTRGGVGYGQSAHADRGVSADVRVVGSKGECQPLGPDAGSGGSPRERARRGPLSLDNSPTAAAGRGRAGPKRSGTLPALLPATCGLFRRAVRPPRGVRWGCCSRWRSSRSRPPRDPVGRGRLRAHHPRAALRAALLAGLAFGVAFYFVQIYWMRAVGDPTPGWRCPLETLFFAAHGFGHRGAAAAPAVAAVVRRRVDRRWRSWRSSWPFSGMPWGRLAFAVVDTPVADALPYAGAVGVSFLLRPVRRAAGLARRRPGRGARASRGWRRSAWSDWWPCSRCPALAPWTANGRPRDHRGRGTGRRPRQR